MSVMTTWANQTKNTSTFSLQTMQTTVYSNQNLVGDPWTYDQVGLTYDQSSISYDTDKLLTTWTNQALPA